MDIKKIILEEVNDFDWVSNDSIQDMVNDTLDNHFGITFNYNSGNYRDIISFNTDENPYVTYNKIRKSSIRDLYKILTNTPKYKTLFSRNYYDMVNILKAWKGTRSTTTMLTREVQSILSRMGTRDAGPR